MPVKRGGEIGTRGAVGVELNNVSLEIMICICMRRKKAEGKEGEKEREMEFHGGRRGVWSGGAWRGGVFEGVEEEGGALTLRQKVKKLVKFKSSLPHEFGQFECRERESLQALVLLEDFHE